MAYNQYIGDAYMDAFNRPEPSRQHSLNRTSPKGGPFVGTCALCGKTGLTFDNMRDECDNQRNLTQDEALIEAVSTVPKYDRGDAT
jgi:hypothetical protein